jgi:hypothetical protein
MAAFVVKEPGKVAPAGQLRAASIEAPFLEFLARNSRCPSPELLPWGARAVAFCCDIVPSPASPMEGSLFHVHAATLESGR